MTEFIQSKNAMETYDPVITRSTISIYEYTRVLTDLSVYLYESPDLNKYIDEIEVDNIIDTNKLAYKLLKEGVFDAILDRGYEKVTFSRLKIDPRYDTLIEAYLEQQDRNRTEGFLKLAGLA